MSYHHQVGGSPRSAPNGIDVVRSAKGSVDAAFKSACPKGKKLDPVMTQYCRQYAATRNMPLAIGQCNGNIDELGAVVFGNNTPLVTGRTGASSSPLRIGHKVEPQRSRQVCAVRRGTRVL